MVFWEWILINFSWGDLLTQFFAIHLLSACVCFYHLSAITRFMAKIIVFVFLRNSFSIALTLTFGFFNCKTNCISIDISQNTHDGKSPHSTSLKLHLFSKFCLVVINMNCEAVHRVNLCLLAFLFSSCKLPQPHN